MERRTFEYLLDTLNKKGTTALREELECMLDTPSMNIDPPLAIRNNGSPAMTFGEKCTKLGMEQNTQEKKPSLEALVVRQHNSLLTIYERLVSLENMTCAIGGEFRFERPEVRESPASIMESMEDSNVLMDGLSGWLLNLVTRLETMVITRP